jgi:hypothetical protein
VDTQTIVILDFGSQYTQLIARRIREQNVFSVVLPCTAPLGEIVALKPLGLILSGGPSSVYDADAPAADPKLLELGVPVLGICYGLHFIVHHLGGKVLGAPRREYGHAEVAIEDAHRAVSGAATHAGGVDEPRRRGRPNCRPASIARRLRPMLWPGLKARSAASGRCNSIPKCTTRRWGRRSSRTLSFRSAGRAGDWTAGALH